MAAIIVLYIFVYLDKISKELLSKRLYIARVFIINYLKFKEMKQPINSPNLQEAEIKLKTTSLLTASEKMAKMNEKVRKELLKSLKTQCAMALIYGWHKPDFLMASVRSLKSTVEQILLAIEPELPFEK